MIRSDVRRSGFFDPSALIWYLLAMTLDPESCQQSSDNDLVRMSIDNQEYFLCLMRRYEGKLLAYIRRLSRVSQEDAEDLLQEVFIKVFRNLNDFDQDLKFSSWIYRITYNHVISHYRSTAARPQGHKAEMEDAVFNNIADESDLNKELDQKLDKDKLMSVIDTLDRRYRDVIVMKYWEGLEYQEISDILKVPMGTVATMLNRAKKQLAKKIKESNIDFR